MELIEEVEILEEGQVEEGEVFDAEDEEENAKMELDSKPTDFLKRSRTQTDQTETENDSPPQKKRKQQKQSPYRGIPVSNAAPTSSPTPLPAQSNSSTQAGVNLYPGSNTASGEFQREVVHPTSFVPVPFEDPALVQLLGAYYYAGYYAGLYQVPFSSWLLVLLIIQASQK